jgi:hypothetical protein
LFHVRRIAREALIQRGFDVIYRGFLGVCGPQYLPVLEIICGPVANHWFVTAQSAQLRACTLVLPIYGGRDWSAAFAAFI